MRFVRRESGRSSFPSLRNASGTGRYRRRVEIPHDWAGRSIVLVMEGVFHETTILVDAAPVARHDDGWTPIEVDLTDALAGKRTFVLGVDARVPDDRNGAGARLSLSLIGKQDWYGLMGGIWKPARLEARNAVDFAQAAVRTSFDLKTGVVTVSGKLSRAAPATTLRVSLSRGGEAVARLVFHFRSADFEAALAVPEAAPWSPEAPNLYAAVIELISEGAVVDAIERVVGFRRFEAREGRLFLNGRPFFMMGALDQDWHPDEDAGLQAASFSNNASPTPRRWASIRSDATSKFPILSISISPIAWG